MHFTANVMYKQENANRTAQYELPCADTTTRGQAWLGISLNTDRPDFKGHAHQFKARPWESPAVFDEKASQVKGGRRRRGATGGRGGADREKSGQGGKQSRKSGVEVGRTVAWCSRAWGCATRGEREGVRVCLWACSQAGAVVVAMVEIRWW